MQLIHKTLSFLASNKYIPFSIRIKAGCLGISLLTLPGKLKDKYLGVRRVSVVKVMWDWAYYEVAVGELVQIRDIQYRIKRDKLPWFSTKVLKGTQVQDPERLPGPLRPHNELVELIRSTNAALANIKQQQQNKRLILNPQFEKVNTDG